MICEVVIGSALKYTSQCSWYTETIYRIVQDTQKGQFKKRPTLDDKRMDMNYELDINEALNVLPNNTLPKPSTIDRSVLEAME